MMRLRGKFLHLTFVLYVWDGIKELFDTFVLFFGLNGCGLDDFTVLSGNLLDELLILIELGQEMGILCAFGIVEIIHFLEVSELKLKIIDFLYSCT